MKIKNNIKLSKYNTFRTGGNARFFCEVETEKELLEVLNFSKKNKLKFFIIGNGSNLLVKDEDFDGLIIKIAIKGIKIEKDNTVLSYAGENFDDLIKFCEKNSLSGPENLWNIPGTVGAAIVQNIGAYGTEVKNFIYLVEGIDTKNLKEFSCNNRECAFGYRDSVFKKNKNLIITKVVFKLSKKFVPNLRYSVFAEYFCDKNKPTMRQVIKAVEKIRKEKLPDWKKLGTAGSFFKNPIITLEKYNRLLKKYPNLPRFNDKKGFVKIPLGFVIDKICGLKGYRKGNVGIYKKQSLVIVNYGGATFFEINFFAKMIENKVFQKIKIKIEREVENFF